MDTNTYWNKQREITTEVRACAITILSAYPQLFQKYIWLTNLLDAEKKERSSVRAAMTCLMYEACGEDTWEGAIGIAATGELEITSLYHLNRLLDRKGSGS